MTKKKSKKVEENSLIAQVEQGAIAQPCEGLPPELCPEYTLMLQQQVIKVRLERRRRFYVTVIEGFDQKAVDIKELASKLKSKLACGGTAKNGRIELQGDHRHKVREILIEMGFPPENIIVE